VVAYAVDEGAVPAVTTPAPTDVVLELPIPALLPPPPPLSVPAPPPPVAVSSPPPPPAPVPPPTSPVSTYWYTDQLLLACDNCGVVGGVIEFTPSGAADASVFNFFSLFAVVANAKE